MKAKSIGLFSIVYGVIGCGFGLFALLITYAVQKMIVNFKPTEQVEKMKIYIKALQDVWLIYMPAMILIGLIYLFSGYLLNKHRKQGISVGMVAAIFNILWSAGYTMNIISNVIPVSSHPLKPAVQIFVTAIVGIVTCLYPLYFLLTFKNIELMES